MKEAESGVQLIACPKCEGKGRDKLGLNCPECSGPGLGCFFKGKFLYWDLKLGKAVIRLRHIKKGLHLFINLTAFLIGVLGLIALSWWLWKTSANSAQYDAFAFWRTRNLLILFFWVSTIADMFIIYRLSEEEASKVKIKKFKEKIIGRFPPFNYIRAKTGQKAPNNWSELKKYKKKIDVSRGYSYPAIKAVEDSYLLANKYNLAEVNILHLFFSILKDKEVINLFIRLNVNGKKIIEKIKNQLQNQSENNGANKRLELSRSLKEALVESYIEAYELGQKKVMPINFIIPCLKRDKILEEILYDFAVDQNKIKNVIQWFRSNKEILENNKLYKKAARFKPGKGMNRAYTAVATPILNHFSYDLTLAAKWGRLDLCVARDKELENIFRIFESGRRGVILTGAVGVGKRSIIYGLAKLMVKEEVPGFLRDKRLVELDLARLISGASPVKAEERLQVVMEEIKRAGNIILYIENLENLSGISVGGEESLELAEVLSNAIERNILYCLSSATEDNYAKYIEKNAIGNAMARVIINEPVGNQAIQMVESKIGFLENKYKVYFSYNAIEKTIELASKYIHDKYLPAKAIEILEGAAIGITKRCSLDPSQCLCTKDDIAEAISGITRIPVHKVAAQESERLLNLEKYIHEQMIDQEEAVEMVASSLRRARTQMRENKRPIANFLFLGPTGVGKTQLAKTVAQVYFGEEDYMIRIDMSEYQHQDSIKKMIGDGQGMAGYLTEAVRKQPFSLILLDEFEKAGGDVLNLFLQVMDDGRLTDGQGKTIDFTSCIIIATSNIGSVFIQKEISAGVEIEKIRQVLIDEHLNKYLRPELVNRFDGIIVFKPLGQEEVVDITRLMLNKVNIMLKAKGMSLRAEEEGVRSLAQEGYNPKFGARPLRRLIQEKIENKIANFILEGRLSRRDTVVIDANAEVRIEKGREL
ncbi:MAG: AAA family ATPase [Patescibacteria group bacterium]